MSISHTLNWSVTDGSTVLGQGSYTSTGDIADRIDTTINNGVTNQALAFSVVKAKLQSIVISTTVDMTIKTNSSGSPTDTLLVKANSPVIWNKDEPATNCPCPFSADVTQIFVTNTSGNAGSLKIFPNQVA